MTLPLQMAEQDFLPAEGLGYEQSFAPASGDTSNPQSETSDTHRPESTIFPSENLQSPELEDLDFFNPIQPPPLDWRSDSSSDAGSVGELESCSVGEFEVPGTFNVNSSEDTILAVNDFADQNLTEASDKTEELCENKLEISDFQKQTEKKKEKQVEERQVLNVETEKETEEKVGKRDLDHSHIQSLLTQLHLFHPSTPINSPAHYHPDDSANHSASHDSYTSAETAIHSSVSADSDRSISSALLFSQEYQKDLLQLLEDPEPEEPGTFPQLVYTPLLTPSAESWSRIRRQSSDADEMISISHSQDIWHRHLQDELLVTGIAEEDQWAASESLSPDQSVGENNDMVKGCWFLFLCLY